MGNLGTSLRVCPINRTGVRSSELCYKVVTNMSIDSLLVNSQQREEGTQPLPHDRTIGDPTNLEPKGIVPTAQIQMLSAITATGKDTTSQTVGDQVVEKRDTCPSAKDTIIEGAELRRSNPQAAHLLQYPKRILHSHLQRPYPIRPK